MITTSRDQQINYVIVFFKTAFEQEKKNITSVHFIYNIIKLYIFPSINIYTESDKWAKNKFLQA